MDIGFEQRMKETINILSNESRQSMLFPRLKPPKEKTSPAAAYLYGLEQFMSTQLILQSPALSTR